MKIKGTILGALVLAALGATAVTAQQASPPASAKKLSYGQLTMANEPHHLLAMAYQQNILVFVQAVENQMPGANPVNVEFARAAVDEMRRSFDRMKEHQKDHMDSMSAEMRTATSAMVKNMETHQSGLNTELAAMEDEVKLTTPDAKKLATLAGNVHKHLDAMSKMKQDMTMKN